MADIALVSVFSGVLLVLIDRLPWKLFRTLTAFYAAALLLLLLLHPHIAQEIR